MKRELGELELIERIRSEWAAAGRGAPPPAAASRARSPSASATTAPSCARPRGHELLVTTDFTLEGRHFRRDWHPPESAGHRTLARGFSDLAAMGARPLAAFLSLALPGEMLATRAGRVWVERFFAGLRSLADRHAVPLAGGDTSESPCGLVLADIVLIGSAPAGRALRRSGGRAGDALYVTGELGGAAAELAAMDRRAEKNPAHPYKDLGASSFRFLRNGWSPRRSARRASSTVPSAAHRRRSGPSAASSCHRRIDLSDGLSTDLAHLCRESGVGARISAAALPIHPLAQQTRAVQTVSAPNRASRSPSTAARTTSFSSQLRRPARVPRTFAGVRVTRIGSLVRGRSISLLDPTGRRFPLQPGGWEHFTGKHEGLASAMHDSTRIIRSTLTRAVAGEPLHPSPVFAAPYHTPATPMPRPTAMPVRTTPPGPCWSAPSARWSPASSPPDIRTPARATGRCAGLCLGHGCLRLHLRRRAASGRRGRTARQCLLRRAPVMQAYFRKWGSSSVRHRLPETHKASCSKARDCSGSSRPATP